MQEAKGSLMYDYEILRIFTVHPLKNSINVHVRVKADHRYGFTCCDRMRIKFRSTFPVVFEFYSLCMNQSKTLKTHHRAPGH